MGVPMCGTVASPFEMAHHSPEFLKIMELDSDYIASPATRGSDYDSENMDPSKIRTAVAATGQERVFARTLSGLRNSDSRRNSLSEQMSQIQTEPKRFSKQSRFEVFSHADLAVPKPTPTSVIRTNGSQELDSPPTIEPIVSRFGSTIETNVDNDVSVFISNLLRNSHLSPTAASIFPDHHHQYSPEDLTIDKLDLNNFKIESRDTASSDREVDNPNRLEQIHQTRSSFIHPHTWKSPSSKIAPEKLIKLGGREISRPRAEVAKLTDPQFTQPTEISKPQEAVFVNDRQRLDAPRISGLSLSRPSLSKKPEAQGSPPATLNAPKWVPNHRRSLLQSPDLVLGSGDQLLEEDKQEQKSLPELLSATTSSDTAREEPNKASRSNELFAQTQSDGESSLFTQLGYSYDHSRSHNLDASPSGRKKLRSEKLQIRDIQMRAAVGATVRTSLWFGTNSESSHISSEIVLSRFDTLEENQSSESGGAMEDVFAVAETENRKKLKNISEFVVSFRPTACGLYSALIQFKSRKKVFSPLPSVSQRAVVIRHPCPRYRDQEGNAPGEGSGDGSSSRDGKDETPNSHHRPSSSQDAEIQANLIL
jgi:hypothetical protein